MKLRIVLVAALLAVAATAVPAAADPVCFEQTVELYWQKQVNVDGVWTEYDGGSLDLGWRPDGFTPPTAPDGYRYAVVDERIVDGDPIDCPTTTTVPETTTTLPPETTTTTEAPPVTTTTTVDLCDLATTDHECGEQPEQTPPPAAPPADPPVDAPQLERLPRTGVPSALLVAVALGLLSIGTALVTAERRRA